MALLVESSQIQLCGSEEKWSVEIAEPKNQEGES